MPIVRVSSYLTTAHGVGRWSWKNKQILEQVSSLCSSVSAVLVSFLQSVKTDKRTGQISIKYMEGLGFSGELELWSLSIDIKIP